MGTRDKGLGSSFCGRQPKAWLLEEMGNSKLPGLMLKPPRSNSCNLFPREVGCHGMLMITIPQLSCSQTFCPGEDLALLWFTCLAQKGEILGERQPGRELPSGENG